MNISFRKISGYTISICITSTLIACAGDPMESGLDPYAPMVFKEGVTTMPLNPPNPGTLIPFYVSETTIFKFAVDTDSISIGKDGVTRYIVVMTNPSGEKQAQYEGIRCDSFQWRLYGTLENNVWRENPLSSWRAIPTVVPNRYQAALAQGAFCNFTSQEKNMATIQKSLNPNNFTGGTQPSNSFGIIAN
ncbi:CNP1-like family protein [Polynucleobacter sp. MWH-Svant-W18]|uniref:CNP1-like family protein n=1 Tax=Polynucleobacter sp. MWH-Svant-W18 TaxID=1855909 RepID=UPI001BFD011E|nr:CNP1-like family protein [Polynucleobacter sp. MWH-Svant-W18]QWD78169.1 CNP1-like family protein [Polynucleobacter sp. MWH-Svant-W18]